MPEKDLRQDLRARSAKLIGECTDPPPLRRKPPKPQNRKPKTENPKTGTFLETTELPQNRDRRGAIPAN